VPDSALPAATPTVATTGDWLTAAPPAAAGDTLEAIFAPDPNTWDGRFANNGWLQELPKPLTKLTWDNAALFSPATAERLGLTNGDVVTLSLNGRSVRGPVWILPGHADNAVTLPLGYGRATAGHVGSRIGFNAYALRTSDAPWFAAGLEVAKTGERVQLATTQMHYNMEGRDLVLAAPIDEFRANPEVISEHSEHPEASIYPEWEYKGHAWGMSIDLNACVSCNACVLACVAENNTPVVGKEQVLRQREMQWLRIDTYFEGDPAELNPVFQPMLCQHCENAPCEPVCPVGATVHSSEGLNDMVYNRCVGTRYCSNNCPYKVRRFNFLQFQDWTTESLKPMRNPDVTVRQRGVMEKCTYCVQRIEEARSAAIREGRDIRDGDIQTACQQACPTKAIIFGDINDPNAAVTKLKQQPQNYGVLTHLNTQPRTTYMARFSNPNPEIEASSA
jgi:Fe-S-cluster-containing dehydrogenase component